MLLGLIFATVPVVASAQQPNVVVLMTDDQTADSMWAMPWTRELIGAEGVTFTNSFVSYPRCCPSRATFFTGQYAHNHGVLSNTLPFGSYDRLETSSWLPLWLQAAGYRTAHLGKFLNGYGDVDPTEIPPGWTSGRDHRARDLPLLGLQGQRERAARDRQRPRPRPLRHRLHVAARTS